MKTKVAIVGSGNIGSDLMMKVVRLSDTLAHEVGRWMSPTRMRGVDLIVTIAELC